MDGTVKPIDNRLIEMLKGAKKVMKKVESGDYSTGNVNPQALTENGVKALHDSGFVPERKVITEEVDEVDYEERVKKSGLPDAVKKAMLEKRIDQPTMGAFSKEDVRSLIDEDEEPVFKHKVVKKEPVKQVTKSTSVLNETRIISNQGDTITIGRNELKGMIKDTLIEYLSGEYSKTLTETVIKQTINTLIKEGKLTVKKKI